MLFIFTNDVHEAFLAFLRNLTPQILLLSVAIIESLELDINKFDFSNILNTLPFILVMVIFFAAVIANILTFIKDSCKSTIASIDKDTMLLHAQETTWFKYFKSICIIMWKNSKRLIIEVLVIVLIIQVSLWAVFCTSQKAAAGIYSTIHGER